MFVILPEFTRVQGLTEARSWWSDSPGSMVETVYNDGCTMVACYLRKLYFGATRLVSFRPSRFLLEIVDDLARSNMI